MYYTRPPVCNKNEYGRIIVIIRIIYNRNINNNNNSYNVFVPPAQWIQFCQVYTNTYKSIGI